MTRNRRCAASLAVTAGLLGAALAVSAPAHADPATDAFLAGLASQGLGDINPATASSVGRSVCPMLVEPGQNLANVAAEVSRQLGSPLGPATAFTGFAISAFCPGAVASLADGRSPFPLGFLGF